MYANVHTHTQKEKMKQRERDRDKQIFGKAPPRAAEDTD